MICGGVNCCLICKPNRDSHRMRALRLRDVRQNRSGRSRWRTTDFAVVPQPYASLHQFAQQRSTAATNAAAAIPAGNSPAQYAVTDQLSWARSRMRPANSVPNST